MANSIKVVMNHNGIEALLASSEVQSDLLARGERIKSAADATGSGVYDLAQRPGKKGGRPYVVVAANNAKSMASNMKHNTLLKAMNAGR
jgi:hypothetical protein